MEQQELARSFPRSLERAFLQLSFSLLVTRTYAVRPCPRKTSANVLVRTNARSSPDDSAPAAASCSWWWYAYMYGCELARSNVYWWCMLERVIDGAAAEEKNQFWQKFRGVKQARTDVVLRMHLGCSED